MTAPTVNGVSRSGSGCSLKGFAVGILGCLIVGAGFQYSAMVLRTGSFSGWHFTIGANIMLFLMALIVNPALGLMRRSWMLTPAELTQVYVMWIVGSAVTVSGFVSPLLPQIASLAYYASPENNWAELVLPHVPDWAIPSKDAELLRDFYEGRSDGVVPWGLWLPPLLHWLPLILSLHVAMISIVVILRKQWVDHERLVYPMMQLPIAMIQDDDEGRRPSLIKPLFKNWLFWVGFALPFIIGMHNGLARYFPIDPIYISGGYFYIFRESVRIRMGISFMMIGFAYFIRRDVTLGLCFFFAIYVCYQIVSTIQGGGKYDPLISPWSKYGPSSFAFQGLGAFVALVGVGLWNARHHLVRVARRTIGLGTEDDSGEIMSYRFAALAAVCSLCFMSLWMWSVGLPAWIAPLFILIAFIIYLGITRIVAEGGMPWFFPPIIATDVIVGGVGTRALEPSGIIAFGFTYAWASDLIILVMVSAANGLKVIEETVRRRRRLLFWSMIAGLIVTLCSGIGMMLDVSYEHGGLNTSHYFKDQGFYPWADAAGRMGTRTEPNPAYWGHTALGAVVMALLMFARHRFVSWPFHPIGFPVSFAMGKMFISVLLAWMIKSAAIGYGGPRLFRKLRPLFLGLIIGDWMPSGVMALIELVRVNV